MSCPHADTFRGSRGSQATQGYTLLEVLVAAALAGVFAGLTVPSLAGLRARTLVAGAAAAFESDLQQARAFAWASGQVVHLAFRTAAPGTPALSTSGGTGGTGGAAGAGGGCYVLHTGEPGDCRCDPARPTAAPACDAGAQALRVAPWPAGSGVTLAPNVASATFDPLRGTVTPAFTLRLAGPQAATLHQVVNVMGRVRTCTPDPAWKSWPAC